MSGLAAFSAATRSWFAGAFDAPTPAQAQAWASIASGAHTLVAAPTGSGKTLAAFGWAIDRLITAPTDAAGCRVVYVSPLKALAADIERNLVAPLAGVRRAATDLGLTPAEVRVAVRTGDTPAEERRRFAREPSDILITTPESLFLLLTSAARDALRAVDTVIIDEVHAVFGTKRGAHLAVSLDRLDALLPTPAQRIGLSATARPMAEVARFLAGGRPVTIVEPPADKQWDLRVEVGVPDLGDLTGDSRTPSASIWPHIERRVAELIAAHPPTLVFTNSRRAAETLTGRLNELQAERTSGVRPAEAVPGAGGEPHGVNLSTATAYSFGAPAALARAHHGSVSREERAETEAALKAGELPAVVATSSLELGIDMGEIDLVVQVEAPPSVASGLQRVGRAGHQVGVVSRGVFFPKFAGDLLATTVIVERMRAGDIEAGRIPANPLDVLAQQVVAMVAVDPWHVTDLLALLRRSAPYANLTRGVLETVLDMLSGHYPSDDFADLRPRLNWDRAADRLTARRGAQRVAVTSGGTIPDRGQYGVFTVGEGPGRRVGELDEEMVYETRVGDAITLGTSTWRVTGITADQVQVVPAPGRAGRLPFWKGDMIGRPAELGRAVGAFVREVAAAPQDAARARLAAAGLDEWASDNLLAFLDGQRAATGTLPSDRTIVVERFVDELGDWRVVIHSPFGARVHAPWALVIAARLAERAGIDAHVMPADDGIVLRLPDAGGPPSLAAALAVEPEQVRDLVTEQVGTSALFAARFRECAGRALLLPNRRPGRRQPLWLQRQRAAQLLGATARFPNFPVVLETLRECLDDVFDLPALVDVMTQVRSGAIEIVEVTTPAASPFASGLMFGYLAQAIYAEDQPLAERRAAALAFDPALLAELSGADPDLDLRALLDPAAIADTEAELQCLTPGRRARDADEITDLLRMLGPLTATELAERSVDFDPGWLGALAAEGRALPVPVPGPDGWCAPTDAGRLAALGVEVPVGAASEGAEPEDREQALVALLARFARTHGPFTRGAAAARLCVPLAPVVAGLGELVAAGRLVAGEFTSAGEPEYCDPDVLRTIKRRSIAALRAEIAPVTQDGYARFLADWHGLGLGDGTSGVLRAVEQLAGVPLPAAALETLILPARVPGYTPALLDELCATGEVVWWGGGEGSVVLAPADLADALGPRPTGALEGREADVMGVLSGGGAWTFAELAERIGSLDGTADALWALVWRGRVTADTLAPLRARAAGRAGTRPAPVRARMGLRGRAIRPGSHPGRPATGDVAGRWSAVANGEASDTERLWVATETLLDRHGVLTRRAVEDLPGGFAAAYGVLSVAEEAGRVRRGYFVDGLGAAQFATAGVVDRLRATPATSPTRVLAASDPVNPYGVALPWPATAAGRPNRRAGTLVVMRDGRPLAHLERGGRSVLTWGDEADAHETASVLAALVRAGRVDGLSVERVDGEASLGSGHPLVAALLSAGFHQTPRGVRLRR